MKRYLALAAMLAAATLHAATVTIDVQVDQSKIVVPPAEKAAFCGAVAPTCPEVPVPPTPPTPPSNPPPSEWNGVCPGYANTRVLTLDWATPKRLFTVNAGGFGITDAVVVKFTTGSVSTAGSLAGVAASEYSSAPSTRDAALSDKPCDFEGLPNVKATSNSITFRFGLGAGSGFGYWPVLKLNTPYYLNLRNVPASTCSINAACDMFVDLIKPGGL